MRCAFNVPMASWEAKIATKGHGEVFHSAAGLAVDPHRVVVALNAPKNDNLVVHLDLVFRVGQDELEVASPLVRCAGAVQLEAEHLLRRADAARLPFL